MRPSQDTWYILNPHNSNQVLHEVDGIMEFHDSLIPKMFFFGKKRVVSKPVTYKTSRGALNRSRKHFPEWREHSAQTKNYLLERTDEYGKIWSYRGQWDDENLSRIARG